MELPPPDLWQGGNCGEEGFRQTNIFLISLYAGCGDKRRSCHIGVLVLQGLHSCAVFPFDLNRFMCDMWQIGIVTIKYTKELTEMANKGVFQLPLLSIKAYLSLIRTYDVIETIYCRRAMLGLRFFFPLIQTL